MKLMIGLGIFICSTAGGWLGASLSHGNWFSVSSLALSIVGCFVGIWAGYKAGQALDL